jgi:hypothetical protein
MSHFVGLDVSQKMTAYFGLVPGGISWGRSTTPAASPNAAIGGCTANGVKSILSGHSISCYRSSITERWDGPENYV